MSQRSEDARLIRQYLLGALVSEDDLRRIEESLLTGGEFFEELLIAEDELIDAHLSGALSSAEEERFQRHFLATPERWQKLRFARALGRYVASAAEARPEEEVPHKEEAAPPASARRAPFRAAPFFTFSYGKLAAALLLVAGLGWAFWWAFFSQSEVRRGLSALQAAYSSQRPIEARLTGFGYAPFTRIRGAETANIDYVSRDRAASLLLQAVRENPSAAAHHALGKYYLTNGDFAKAIDQFETALQSDPDNAQLRSDLGAALLEKGSLEQSSSESGNSLETFARSLQHLDRALALDPGLLEALFNRALLRQRMMLWQQARDDWQAYLQRDAASPWAAEAREHLRLLENRLASVAQSNEEVLQDFLRASQESDEERAWRIISRNREAITGKMIWLQLVRAYLAQITAGRDDEARRTRLALTYAGELEARRSGDSYTAGIAAYYRAAAPPQLAWAAQAHDLMAQGHELCLSSRFSEAVPLFSQARQLLEQAGNEPEALFAAHWLSYCYSQLTGAEQEQSLALSERIASACESRNYKWLLVQSLSMQMRAHEIANEYSAVIERGSRLLTVVEQLEDTYSLQKALAHLAMTYRNLGRYDQALTYLQRCLILASAAWPGERQMWRTYDTGAILFYSLGSYAAAAAYGKEALRLASEQLGDPSTSYLSHTRLGLIYGKLQNYAEGVRHAQAGYVIGEAHPNVVTSRRMMAHTAAQLGHLQRQAGEIAQALSSYEQAISLYDRLGFEVENYEVRKGRLMCYLARGDDALAERELAVVLTLFERNRQRIAEEENRNVFFDREQSTYDLAIDFAYTHARDERRAFEYSENARARSLLDLMEQGAARHSRPQAGTQRQAAPEILISSASQPLSLARIQAQMPDEIQIVQYAVLPERLLIWVISKTGFASREASITADDLRARVLRYLRAASGIAGDREEAQREAAELYRLLISPVEPLLDGRQLLCIVPDKALNHLPFGALISPVTGRYLINDFALLFAPSANILVLSSQAARERETGGGERLLSVGDPTFERRSFPALPDLPSARREAAAVAEFYPASSCLLGDNATTARVISELEHAEVAHFATHHVPDEQSPARSRLLLAQGSRNRQGESAPGALQAQDIYRLRLPRMRLVVLSACRTGAERYYDGEGMIGISRSFIAAGVPLVVGSQWPVDSDATAELMISFHRYRRRAGLSTAEALRRAQLEMLNHSQPRYREPHYWAAFIVIGGYARF